MREKGKSSEPTCICGDAMQPFLKKMCGVIISMKRLHRTSQWHLHSPDATHNFVFIMKRVWQAFVW